jgi:hypothetical protein
MVLYQFAVLRSNLAAPRSARRDCLLSHVAFRARQGNQVPTWDLSTISVVFDIVKVKAEKVPHFAPWRPSIEIGKARGRLCSARKWSIPTDEINT